MKKLIAKRYSMKQYCTYNFSLLLKRCLQLISNDWKNPPFSKKGGLTKFENYRAIMGLPTISQLLESKWSLSGLKPPEIFNIKLNSEEAKYFGITLHKKLTWYSHLQSRVKRTYMWLMSNVGGQWDVHEVFHPVWSPGSTLQ